MLKKKKYIKSTGGRKKEFVVTICYYSFFSSTDAGKGTNDALKGV